MGYIVVMSAQNVRKTVLETSSEKEAFDFCERNHWVLRDENEFVWDLDYEEI